MLKIYILGLDNQHQIITVMLFFYNFFMNSKVPELDLFLNTQTAPINQYRTRSSLATAQFPSAKDYLQPKFYYPISPIHSLDVVEVPPPIPPPLEYIPPPPPLRPIIQEPTHHFYDLSKQVLKGNYYVEPIINKNRYLQSGQRNIPQRDIQNKKQKSYSISKDPYLNDSKKNNMPPQQPRNKIFDDKPKKGIENISFGMLNQINQANNQPKPIHRIKTEEQIKEVIEPKKINKFIEKRDNLEIIKNFENQELAELFIDILNHEQIDTSKQEYIDDWLKILKEINNESSDNKQKELRRRIRDWRRRVQNLQQSIISNNSIYSEGNLNESMMRRQLQQYEQKERNFQNKLNLLFQETEELDFNLQKTSKTNKELDLGGLIKLKNESINLHREYANKLNNLIDDYQNKKEQKQDIYSFFS